MITEKIKIGRERKRATNKILKGFLAFCMRKGGRNKMNGVWGKKNIKRGVSVSLIL